MATPTIAEAKANISAQIDTLQDMLRVLEAADTLLAGMSTSAEPKASTQVPRTQRRSPKGHVSKHASQKGEKDPTIAQIAKQAKVHITTVYIDIRAGRLHPIKGSRPVRCEEREVKRWLAARKGDSARSSTVPSHAAGRISVDEEEEQRERARLLALVRGADVAKAKAALQELKSRYRVTLPLDEKRLGITV